MHPLMTVTPEGTVFDGAACAVAGNTPRALATATALARALGMKTFEIADGDRALYHAAASLASNFLVTIEGAAERLASLVGVGREQLAPLARAAVENWARVGSVEALTGPIARGDQAVAARQRAAVAARASDLLPLWDALSAATRDLARSADSRA